MVCGERKGGGIERQLVLDIDSTQDVIQISCLPQFHELGFGMGLVLAEHVRDTGGEQRDHLCDIEEGIKYRNGCFIDLDIWESVEDVVKRKITT